MLDFTRDLAVELCRIERFNPGDAAAGFEQGLPGGSSSIANRTEQTDAGDYDSAGNNRLSLQNDRGAVSADDIRRREAATFSPPRDR